MLVVLGSTQVGMGDFGFTKSVIFRCLLSLRQSSKDFLMLCYKFRKSSFKFKTSLH
jgi:hypothetical protein